MKYSTKTTWASFRKDEIEYLNEIAENECLNEIQLGRKLNDIKKFKEAFDNEIKLINWDTILNFMSKNKWHWGNSDECPTKEKMIETLSGFTFFKNGIYHIVELGEKEFSVFTGGFNFQMGKYNGTYCVHICFDIAHYFYED